MSLASMQSNIGRYDRTIMIVMFAGIHDLMLYSPLFQRDDGVDAGGATLSPVTAAAIRSGSAQQQLDPRGKSDSCCTISTVPASSIPTVWSSCCSAVGPVGLFSTATPGATAPGSVRVRAAVAATGVSRRAACWVCRAVTTPVLAVPSAASVSWLVAGLVARRQPSPGAPPPAPASHPAPAAQPYLVIKQQIKSPRDLLKCDILQEFIKWFCKNINDVGTVPKYGGGLLQSGKGKWTRNIGKDLVIDALFSLHLMCIN